MVPEPDAHALHELAQRFAAAGHFTAALGAARRAVAANPRSADLQITFGELCERIGYARDAIGAYEAARRLAPGDAGVLYRLAGALRRRGRAHEALVVARDAERLAPDSSTTCVVLGEAQLANGSAEEADEQFVRALARDPASAFAECGRAGVAYVAARWDDARAAFERALQIDPACAEALHGRALIDLRFGNYRAGFSGYAAIMRTIEQRPRYHYLYAGVPLWDGTPLGDRRLTIAFEQGLGDQLMMARFLGGLARFGGKVTVEAPPANAALLRRNFPYLDVLDFTTWQPVEAMDVQLPFMQLPAALGVTREAEIAACMPYLTAAPERVAALRQRIRGDAGVRHVGVVWHGNRENARERWRGTQLTDWGPLTVLRNVRFHSLQLGATAHELAAAPFGLEPAHELIRDMEDTAALVTLMDAVVSVDTAVAHLAGALARPVFLPDSLISDFRWGVERNDTPWYPSMRIFRQRERDAWAPVFAAIASELARRWS